MDPYDAMMLANDITRMLARKGYIESPTKDIEIEIQKTCENYGG